MAKSYKNKSSQALSVDDIYEILKGKNFTEDLWMEMLSDIKEKPTYMRMKEMVTAAVNNKLKDFEQEPIDHAERTQRRAALTEISIMAYTVDRVISEVLYKRLENEFKTLIVDMLEELQTKKPVEKSSAPVKINSMLENIEHIFSEQSVKEDAKVARSSKKGKTQIPARKRGRPPGNRNLIVSEDSPTEKDADSDGNVSLDSISSVHTTDLSSFDDNVSVCTVDGINGRKKKLDLKTANSMLVEGKLSQIYQIGKKSKKNAVGLAKEAKKVKKDPSRKILPQRKRKPNKKYNAETMYCQVKDYFSDRSDSPNSNPADDIATIQSQVNMKAKNVKTSSDDDKKAKPMKTSSDDDKKAKPVKTSSDDNKKAKRVKTSSDDDKKAKRVKTSSDDNKKVSSVTPVSTRPVRNQSSSDSDAPASPTTQKSSTKRYNASDLYKPRFNFGSTCSTRGTAAYNVFSS